MGLTSRNKRPLNRTILHLRDTRLLIIFSEGAKTEKQYFESKLFRSHRVQVQVIGNQDNKSAPIHVLEQMKSYTSSINLEPKDELWLMIDTDRWGARQLSDVCSKAIRGKKKAKLAVSNPSFELWLYLHFEEWSAKTCSSRQIEAELRNLNGSYNKSRLIIELFEGKVEDAVNRARGMCLNTNELWPLNPGTHVYRVVEAINSVLGNKTL